MTLQLYVLRQLVLSFAFALTGIAFMVMPAITIQAVHRLQGVGLDKVFDYIPMVVTELVPYLAPIAFLLGVVSTFGRLAAENEWTAIRMAGIHPLKVLLPGLVVAVVCAIGTHWLLSTVSPEQKYNQRVFLREAEESEFRSLGQGRTEFEIGDFYLSSSRRDAETGIFHEVIISYPLEDEETGETENVVLVADAISIDFPEGSGAMEVRFLNARTLREDDEFKIESPSLRIPLADLGQQPQKDRNVPKYLTTSEMLARLDGSGLGSGEEPLDVENREAYRYEIQKRIALSVTYLVFLILGAPTGLWLRSGTQLGALTGATAYAFLYYLLSMRLGKELAGVGLIGPGLAAWTTNGIYLAIGLFLLRRMVRR